MRIPVYARQGRCRLPRLPEREGMFLEAVSKLRI